MERETSIFDFYLFGIIAILVILFSLIASTPANASTIFLDDFESYNLGDLVSQGSWGGTPAKFYVEDSVIFEGLQSVSSDVSDNYFITKIGTLTPTGTATIYVKRHNDNGMFFFAVPEGANAYVAIICQDDNYCYRVDDAGSYMPIDLYPDNEWFYMSIEWRDSNHTARYKIEGKDWTGWFATYLNGWVDGPDRIKIGVLSQTTNTTYFDNILESPNLCATLTSAEVCNCQSPLFPKPEYCGLCLWDYPTSTCLTISTDIILPAIALCNALETEPNCVAVDYCVWLDGACDYYNALPFVPETTDPDFGILGNAIRDAIIWAFVPSRDFSYEWQELQNTIQSKAPFGYFFLIKNKILAVEVNPSATPLAVEFSSSLSASPIPLFSFTIVQNFIGSENWDLIQTLIIMVLWGLLIFYIFDRAREIKL